MPIIDKNTAPPVSEAEMKGWIPLHRIEDTGADLSVVADAIRQYPFQRLVYAEGDSWFDKFTPLGTPGTNLLDALRLPVFSGVVDVSHIGDSAKSMTSGWQRRQTEAMFKVFDFDAVLLSAGGNDLKDAFASLYYDLGNRTQGRLTLYESTVLDAISQGKIEGNQVFDEVIKSVEAFIAMRDDAKSEPTRKAPLFVHGYDYLQPRPAPAKIFPGASLGRGPWIYPSLKHAGLDDAQMLVAANKVIDELNGRLRSLVSSVHNVYLFDQRGTLTLAAPASKEESGDWMDEIHPIPEGFEKLGLRYWNPWLARCLHLA